MLLKESGGFEARDPSVIFHGGQYYHCFTVDAAAIYVACADALEKLIDAEPVCVYTPAPEREYSKELWAPELCILNGKCYIYVACDDGKNANHRMYVLENGSSDPLSPYRMAGKITDETDKWAIDGTVFTYGGDMYTVWSGWEGDENVCQNLYIAKMRDPYTVESPRTRISAPEHPWEKTDSDGIRLPFINEGPCAYEKDGVLRILYSASGSWKNHYCIGILTFTGGDPLDAARWEKQPYPALSQEDGYNGPGHCSVFSDGSADYIAFHTYDEGYTAGWDHVHALVCPFRIENGKIVTAP
jgi:GH43 family beta-xylosidase